MSCARSRAVVVGFDFFIWNGSHWFACCVGVKVLTVDILWIGWENPKLNQANFSNDRNALIFTTTLLFKFKNVLLI